MRLIYGILLSILFLLCCGYGMADTTTANMNNPEYWYQAGVSELLLDHYDKALTYLNAAVEQNPKLASAWYWLGVAQEATGKTTEAKQSYAQAKELDPYISDPYRKKVGALADLSVTPVPTPRPENETHLKEDLVSTSINLTKTPDPTGADVVVHDISAVVAEGGSELQITTTLSNDGKKPTTNFYLTYYLSNSPNGAADDQAVGYYLISNLLPGNTKKIEGYVSLDKITPGEYYVIASADPTYQIREVSKDNNVQVTPYTVKIEPSKTSAYVKEGAPGQVVVTDVIGQDKILSPKPDLVIDSLSGPDSAAPGDQITIDASIRNKGDAAAGVTKMSIFLSPNKELSANNTIIGRDDVASFTPGQIRKRSVTIPIPNDTVEGSYYLGMMIDSAYHIDEKDESNNVLFSSSPIKIVSPKNTIAHLPKENTKTVTSTTASIPLPGKSTPTPEETPVEEESSSVEAVEITAMPTTPEITPTSTLVPTTEPTTVPPTLVVTSTVSPVPTTKPTTVPTTLEVTPTVTPSPASEVITQNNTTVSVTPEKANASVELPDLVVTDIKSDATGKAGGIIALTTAVRNQGTADAGAFSLALYLTQNKTVSPDDIRLGTGKIESLPAGMQRNGSAKAPIPSDIKAGTYYYGIIIDPENAILESNKTNNAAIQKTPITIS